MANTFIPQQYLADHLVLLVGENPIPNAVAATCLVTPGGQITLLHTAATEEIANSLRRWIDNYPKNARVNYRKVDESEPASIYEVTQNILDSGLAGVVGLNYTGGTKSMAVHAYRAFDDWGATNHATVAFSYLDARNLEVVINLLEAGNIVGAERVKVGRKISIPLDQMITLRGWTFHRPPSTDPILPHTATALMELTLDAGTWRKWIETRRAFLSSFRDRDKGWLLPEHDLLDRLMFEKSDAFPETLRQALRDDGLDLESCTVRQAAEKAYGINLRWHETPHQDVLKYFEGCWLESYCLSQLQPLMKNGVLDAAMCNLLVEDPRFEIDVVAICGYQLFLFSCTTIDKPDKKDKSELKQKLFEAYVRSRQLGGDEARVVLVTLSNYPDEIELEMSQFMGGEKLVGERRVKVFGRQQLKSLGEYIGQWIVKQAN